MVKGAWKMTLSELYQEAARVSKMVEGTEIRLYECVKMKGYICKADPVFHLNTDSYEFALTIVEGKPVFNGDKLYDKNTGEARIINGTAIWRNNVPQYNWIAQNFSWNQPKPKTVMVELLREDAEYWASMRNYPSNLDYKKASDNFYNAVVKALEE